jgi:hypothetical protein
VILALWIRLDRWVFLLARMGWFQVRLGWLTLVMHWLDWRIALLDWRIQLSSRDALHKNESGTLNDPVAGGQDVP